MYSQSDIEDAVAGGALTAGQAASLRDHVAARTGVPTADEEHVRILLGFNDLYVFYSALLFLFGLGWLGGKIVVVEGGISPFIGLFVAAAGWGLGEIFARRRRQALPGIAFAACFVYGVFLSTGLLAIAMLGPESFRGTSGSVVNALCAFIATGAALLHWKRFREPVTVALGVGMAATAVRYLAGTADPHNPNSDVMKLVLLILGVAIFFYAMMWDAKDRRRETARADVAFWLHLTASWMVVLGLALLLHLEAREMSVGLSVMSILLFVLFALIALAVDRRIWALAAAYPLGVGVYHVIRGDFSGLDNDYGGYRAYGGTNDNMMATILVIGALLLLLGMAWSPLRRLVVSALPEGLRERLPAAGETHAAEPAD